MKHLRFSIPIFFVQIFFVQISRAQVDAPQDLSRYYEANIELKENSGAGGNVIYIGDSITDFWIGASPDFFKQNHYIDRGINAEASSQMLLRFRADVIDLKPKVVVLLCGTNDIARSTGPDVLEMVKANIMSMTELAQIHHIKIILCSVLPAVEFGWSPNVQPADIIIELNKWIKKYAEENNLIYADYYKSMVNENKGTKKEYTEDGVHPSVMGYQVMQALIKPAIDKALNL